MAPRSPTLAFDPTPALEHNIHNYSPFNHEAMLSVDSHFPNYSKEVRFTTSPTNNFHRAHSIATDNVPLLPQVSSASQIPKQAFRIANPSTGIDLDAYIENCRNLNEQLRTAHDTERRAWNIERSALKAKIADLEFRLNKSQDTKRRSSIESSTISSEALRSDFRSTYNSTKKIHANRSQSVPEPAPFTSVSAPVWRGSEHGTPTTRVFHDEKDNHHLPSISEDDSFPLLSKEISPTSNGLTVVQSAPVSIEQVEPTLDGVTLKLTGFTSSFVTKITSPQFGTPVQSPSPKAKIELNGMHLDTSDLLAPMDEKLKRHAGHTPMNFEGAEASGNVSNQTTEQPTPQPEKPLAPAPSARPPLRPSEGSDSYFSVASDGEVDEQVEAFPAVEQEKEAEMETKDDKPLKGPLMLDPNARSTAAESFLSSVDAKLMQAVKEVSPTRRESILSEGVEGVMVPATALQSTEEEDRQPESKTPQPDDDMPRLKMKKSMNFGSAYGSKMPGWPR